MGGLIMEKLKGLWDGIKYLWTELSKGQKIFIVALIIIIALAIIN